jgi:hypothetical protein
MDRQVSRDFAAGGTEWGGGGFITERGQERGGRAEDEVVLYRGQQKYSRLAGRGGERIRLEKRRKG